MLSGHGEKIVLNLEYTMVGNNLPMFQVTTVCCGSFLNIFEEEPYSIN